MNSRTPSAAVPPERADCGERARARLEAIARVLDSRRRFPGTRARFGADAVLNLLPGVGLLAGTGVSASLARETRRLGVPAGTLLRMIGNVGPDALTSAVTLAGWGGVFWHANLRDVALPRERLDKRRRPPMRPPASARGRARARARPGANGERGDAARPPTPLVPRQCLSRPPPTARRQIRSPGAHLPPRTTANHRASARARCAHAKPQPRPHLTPLDHGMRPAERRGRSVMNQRAQPPLLADVAVGLLAGFVATKATDLAQGPLRRATPDNVKRREARVSPGPSSSQVAARRLAERLGRPADDRRLRPLARAVHHGLGMAWGPVYCLLRRHVGMRPLGAGLAAGAALSLVVDEGLTPALGLSAPNRAYPVATHVRGLLAHLVWGAAAALAAEAVYRLTGTTPRPGRPPNPATAE